MTNLIHLSQHRASTRRQSGTFFTRDEFRLILDIYSRYVMRGQWKDYAIDQAGQKAVFSIFKHSYDAPLFTIVKERRGRNIEFSLNANGRPLKRSRYLINALAPINKPLKMTEV